MWPTFILVGLAVWALVATAMFVLAEYGWRQEEQRGKEKERLVQALRRALALKGGAA